MHGFYKNGITYAALCTLLVEKVAGTKSRGDLKSRGFDVAQKLKNKNSRVSESYGSINPCSRGWRKVSKQKVAGI